MASLPNTAPVFSHICNVAGNLETLWASCEAAGVTKIQATATSGPVQGVLTAPDYEGYAEKQRKLIMRITITALVEKPEPSIAVEPDPPHEMVGSPAWPESTSWRRPLPGCTRGAVEPQEGHHGEWQVADDPGGIDPKRPLELHKTTSPHPETLLGHPEAWVSAARSSIHSPLGMRRCACGGLVHSQRFPAMGLLSPVIEEWCEACRRRERFVLEKTTYPDGAVEPNVVVDHPEDGALV